MVKLAVFTTASELAKVEKYFGTTLHNKGSKYYFTMPVKRTEALKLKDFAPTVPNTTIYVNPYNDQHFELVESTLNGVLNIRLTNYESKILLNREGLA